MNASILIEPELEFGTGRHIDSRFGLSHFGALDAGTNLCPSKIRLGVVGDQQSIGKFHSWVTKCRSGIPQKKTRLATLFPAFPGYSERGPLCDFIVDAQLSRAIASREIRTLATMKNRDELVEASVNRFLVEAEDLYQNTTCDVVICLPSADLLKPIDMGAEARRGPRSRKNVGDKKPHKVIWHDLLKARAIGMRGPVQMVRPATYGGKVHRYRQDGTSSRDIEDEASRAWNFFVALYYKAGGIPWRVPRMPSDLDSCFIGISYFHEPCGGGVQTSVAQVFNERGEGVVVRGGQALVQKDDKTVHMDQETSSELLANALALYRREHKNLPARVVCHKSSYFDEGEMAGFNEVIDRLGIEQVDMLSIRRSSVRFFRGKPNPPLRGTAVQLDDKTALLYTQGSVDFYRSYPGMYIPRPIEVLFDSSERCHEELLQEILALTKMNWNSTRFVNAEPITLGAARNVGAVLKYVSNDTAIQARYSYYM